MDYDNNNNWNAGGSGEAPPQGTENGSPSPQGQEYGAGQEPAPAYQPPQQQYQPPQYQPPQYQQPQYQAPPYQPAPPPYQGNAVGQPVGQPQGSNGMAIASMVCGILSLVLCCGMWISWILSAVAIILGAVSLAKKKGGSGMAIAGIVTGVFGLLFSILFTVILFAAEGSLAYGEYYYDWF